MSSALESTTAAVHEFRRRLGIRGVVLRVSLIIGLGELGFATVVPLLPLYLTDHLGASVFVVGLVIASFALVETVGKTVWGAVGDRIGRRPMIVGGLLLSSVAPLVMSVLRVPLLFVPLRLIDGAGSAALWPAASAIVADESPPDRRATAMGTLNMFFLAGLALGPALGLFVSGFAKSYAPGFYLASLLLAGAGLLALTTLPEAATARRTRAEVPKRDHRGIGSVRHVGEVLEGLRLSPALVMMLMVAFVQAFGLGLLTPTILIYMKHTVGLPEQLIGSLILVLVLTVALASVPGGRVADRWGKVEAVRWGMILGSVGMWVLPLSPRLEVFVFAALLLGASYALSVPAWHALVSELAPPGRVGLAMGAAQTAEGLGFVIGPLLGGALWDIVEPRAPFVAGALLFSLATAVLLITFRRMHVASTGQRAPH